MIEVSKAKGSYIYDNDNNRYLDFVAGSQLAVLGIAMKSYKCNQESI